MKVRLQLLVLLILVPIIALAKDSPQEKWKYDGGFHKLIAEADRIVIRDGGFNCCGPVDGQKVLLELVNPKEIESFNKNLQFEADQSLGACKCCGYPGVDWYKGKKRLVLTSVQHNEAIRWSGFPGDAVLTKESSKWLAAWLQNKGIKGEADGPKGAPKP